MDYFGKKRERTSASYGEDIRKEKRAGRMQMKEHEMELALKSALATQKAQTAGALEERGMIERGLGSRQEKGFEYKRPEQAARIGELEAGTATERYDLGFKQKHEKTLGDIIKQKGQLGQMEIEDITSRLNAWKQSQVVPEAVPEDKTRAATLAKPKKRVLRPEIKKFLSGETTETKSGLKIPGLMLPGISPDIHKFKELGEYLKGKGKEAFEYSFPKR